jgi:hypothetical protein
MTAILRDAHQRRLYTWKLPVRAGATVVKLGLPSRIRKPGRYSLIWIARADTETVSRTLTLRLVTTATAKPKADELEVLLAGPTPAGTALRPGKPGMPRRVRSVANVDRTFDLLAITRRPIGGVVVDADAYGNGFIADLRAVFPAVPVIAISRDPFRRSQSIRAGAVLALPRNASGTELAKAIGRAAAR